MARQAREGGCVSAARALHVYVRTCCTVHGALFGGGGARTGPPGHVLVLGVLLQGGALRLIARCLYLASQVVMSSRWHSIQAQPLAPLAAPENAAGPRHRASPRRRASPAPCRAAPAPWGPAPRRAEGGRRGAGCGHCTAIQRRDPPRTHLVPRAPRRPPAVCHACGCRCLVPLRRGWRLAARAAGGSEARAGAGFGGAEHRRDREQHGKDD